MIRLLNLFFIFFIKIMPKSIIRIFAKQYVAGEEINDVLKVASELNRQGFKTTIDILGEHFTNKKEINEIVSEYINLYKQIIKLNIDSNISIKPTHIGLDISYSYALKNFEILLKTALENNNFLRIDMESSKVTSDTINLYKDLTKRSKNIGLVFQAYLYRTYNDIDSLNDEHNLNFRLCKGIYKESEETAISDYKKINDNYLQILEYAFQNKIYIGIATHDIGLIDKCYELIKKYNVSSDQFEFQVLYGVPMNYYLEKHKQNNYTVRVYVPYGKQWYEYSIRRIQENPNILIYVLKNLFKT